MNITALTSDVLVTQSSANASITSIAQTIYISTTEGDDANDGFSEQSPLKTLARASELGQITGDQVRLKAGDTFFGQLEITGSGTATEPLMVTSYGEGEKPLLNGSLASDSLGSFEEMSQLGQREPANGQKASLLLMTFGIRLAHQYQLLDLAFDESQTGESGL